MKLVASPTAAQPLPQTFSLQYGSAEKAWTSPSRACASPKMAVASQCVHDPAIADYSLPVLKIERDYLFAAFVQFQRRHFGGPHQLAPGLYRFLKQMRVERRAIDLKTSETRSVTRAQLDTI